MKTPSSYDYILVGAGGAGLNLLAALSKEGLLSNHRVLILDPAPKTSNDRTWCFWADEQEAAYQLHQDLISHSWSRINTVDDEIATLAPYRYAQIRSADFYAHYKALAEREAKVEWQQASVERIQANKDLVWVETKKGQKFQARYVFDSRPPQELPNDPHFLWQSFVGWRIRCEQPVFDPDLCAIMDFKVPQSDSVQFCYCLPTSDQEALIELTRFDKKVLSEEEAQPILEEYLLEKGLLHYTILEKEVNKIPMSLALDPQAAQQASPSKRILRIGTAGGAVKASTGFAFKYMASHAREIAQALKSKEPLPPVRRKKQFAFYDDLLLRILDRKPHLGKKIFERLFRRVPIKRVLAFLDEDTTFRQDLSIMAKMPWQPFIWSLFKRLKKEVLGLQSEGLALLLAFLLLFLQQFIPQTLENWSPYLLAIGLLFPGIPHGALDHLAHRQNLSLGPLARFTLQYLTAVVLIFMLWWWFPGLGLLSFLLYSAWHFGETDLRDWQLYTPGRAFLWGSAVLATLLLAHPEQLGAFLKALHLPALNMAQWSGPFNAPASLALVALVMLWLSFPAAGRRQAWPTVLVLFLGLFLPLLLAFGLYFVTLHSFRGWRHLRTALKKDDLALMRQAAPFSLGAFAIGIAGYFLAQSRGWSPELWWPWLFVFVAAISAPHIWIMHRLYRRTA